MNEYGEFEFIPENTGAHRGRCRQVKSGEGFSISETRERIIIHMSIVKQGDRLSNLLEYGRLINKVLEEIKRYEF